MSNGKSPQELLEETHDNVMKISTALFGVPNTDDKGLCGEVRNLKKDYYSFKNKTLIIVGILVGSGVLGVGVYQLLGG